MDKGIKKILFALIALFVLVGCGKQLAPSPVPATPGRSKWQVKREEYRRAWVAYWHDRKTRGAKAKSVKREREAEKAEKKLAERHLKKQPPEVQERMKASLKEAEKNRPKRTLRQRLGFWKYK